MENKEKFKFISMLLLDLSNENKNNLNKICDYLSSERKYILDNCSEAKEDNNINKDIKLVETKEIFIKKDIEIETKIKIIKNLISEILFDSSFFINEIKNPILMKKIDNTIFTQRTTNVLRIYNVLHMGDLLSLSDDEILKMPELGRKSLNEIKEVLHSLGLSLKQKSDN